jgi:hypothetical protein
MTTNQPKFRDRLKALIEVDIDQIVDFEAGNPVDRTAEDIERIDASLEINGYVMPVEVRELGDGRYETIDGHGRISRIREKWPEMKKLKVLVLDVETAAEGRAIMLGLRNHARWSPDQIDDWMRRGLADGLDLEDAMDLTGYTAADLDAFAEAGEDALDQLMSNGDGGGTAGGGPAPRPPRTTATSSHVQFATPLTRDQSADVSSALALAKEVEGKETKGDALVAVCNFYERAHRKGKKPKPKRKKR